MGKSGSTTSEPVVSQASIRHNRSRWSLLFRLPFDSRQNRSSPINSGEEATEECPFRFRRGTGGVSDRAERCAGQMACACPLCRYRGDRRTEFRTVLSSAFSEIDSGEELIGGFPVVWPVGIAAAFAHLGVEEPSILCEQRKSGYIKFQRFFRMTAGGVQSLAVKFDRGDAVTASQPAFIFGVANSRRHPWNVTCQLCIKALQIKKLPLLRT